MTNQEKITTILRHIKRVEDNCNLLSKKFIDTDPDFALELIVRGRNHDSSKFSPYQFESLWKEHPNFESALKFHRRIESHHPESHTCIQDMGELDIAEMVCDCLARSQEFGTDIRDWFFKDEYAPTKYDYKGDKEMINKIKKYVDLLLPPKFE
jgi:hypothetical protein